MGLLAFRPYQVAIQPSRTKKLATDESLLHQLLTESLVHILADGIVIAIVVLVASSIANFAWHKQQRGFFGLQRRGHTELRIVVSSMFIREGGTIGLNPVRHGFTGYAITETEYESASHLASAVQTRPAARFMRVLVDRLSESSPPTPVTARISQSPSYVGRDRTTVEKPSQEMADLLADLRPIVVIGSPLYNSAADFIQSNAARYSHASFYRPADPGIDNIGYGVLVRPFGNDGRSNTFERRQIHESGSPLDGWYYEIGIVQKICDQQLWNAPVFLCSGTSTAATEAAVALLCDWKLLYKRFESSSFVIVFSVTVPNRERSYLSDPHRPKPVELWSFRD